jgi:glycosyltransferase involved in cell wall biosynthesis
VPDYLRLADLLVLPSEHETQALVCPETQACGGVMVASDIPGSREVIEDDQTGLLFRKCDPDPEALAAVMRQAASDPAWRTGSDSGPGHESNRMP